MNACVCIKTRKSPIKTALCVHVYVCTCSLWKIGALRIGLEASGTGHAFGGMPKNVENRGGHGGHGHNTQNKGFMVK